MIAGHGDSNEIVTELQREFASPQKLFVLPAGRVRVGTETRKPLSNFINSVAGVRERFKPRTTTNVFLVVDLVIPIDCELECLAVLERLRQIDSHHGFNDGVLEWLFAIGRYTASDFETTVKGFSLERVPESIEFDFAQVFCRFNSV